jgi:CubicO group peptidase (beta-lactamase class C family)
MNLKTDTSVRVLVTDLEKRVPSLMEEASVPGLSLTLMRDAEIYWSQSFGVRSRVSQEPVTLDTVFEAASLSKPVFAYACLKLCEAGILDLDTPLAEYLPEPYVPDEPRLALVTMRHVLSHTTGFPNWRPKGQALRVHCAPGERFSYSGEGYVYLQVVVEQVTGEPPAEYMRARLLTPLGMENSRFVWTGQEGLVVAIGHDEKGEPTEREQWPDMNAAASLHCTPTDFGRFMCAVMRPSTENAAHLGPQMSKEMLTPQVQVNNSAPWHRDWPRPEIRTNDRVGWGLGWGIQHTSTGDSIWHWGDNGCYQAFAVGFLKEGHGVVIMNNGKKGQHVIKRVLREIIGGDYPGLDWLGQLSAGLS